MLHLIKLCVGCDSVKDLQDWIKEKLAARQPGARKRERNHTTRMVPKRADEIVVGGSLYWVIRGQIMCRERILDIRPFVDKEGIGRCHIALDCKPVLVEPGQQVKLGARVAVMEAMKMEHSLTAPRDGVVAETAAAGTQVIEGAAVVRLEPGEKE